MANKREKTTGQKLLANRQAMVERKLLTNRSSDGRGIHGACCHACLFAPETSCERGNRYLDRAVLVGTFAGSETAFFKSFR